MVKTLKPLILFILAASCVLPRILFAEVRDPFDPFDTTKKSAQDIDEDKDKSAIELLTEAESLLQEEHLLDGRTKLLKALKKDPKEVRTYLLLADYYSVHVGHFRLALKYVKQAQQVFKDKYGEPPYSDPFVQNLHAQILYLFSQARLDLDNYQGALDVLDEFSSYGYYGEWYPGSRAWVLMKLGRIDEAIKTARMGVFLSAEPGRTLNMLGILLSMSGDADAALKIFKDATNYELSHGKLGQPATPLNNAGEVYNEIFKDSTAEESWLKAISMPDGCQHVLPSLNLALLYFQELNYGGAKKSMDDFESCVAQFPLRNGEEHRALVHFVRGRVDLHTGHVDSALKHFEEALQNTQWFGKIGTNQDDLQVATMMSLSQALAARNAHESFVRYSSWLGEAKAAEESIANSIRSWWYARRARQMLTEDLNNLEDLHVRNTDSLIEYHTFGDILAGIPVRAFSKRLNAELQKDSRQEALAYYKDYLAANYLSHSRQAEAISLLNEILSVARPKYDDGIKVHALLLKLSTLAPGSEEYSNVSETIFRMARAELRNYGFRLPVSVSGTDPSLTEELRKSAFILDNSQHHDSEIRIDSSGAQKTLEFHTAGSGRRVKVTGADVKEMVNKFTNEVFTIELQ